VSTGITRIASVNTDEEPADVGTTVDPHVSASGRTVVFSSFSSNLAGNIRRQVYAHELSCLLSSVNAGAGPVVDVLTVNGSRGASGHRIVTAVVHDPITVSLDPAPSGGGTYILWIWPGTPQAPSPLDLRGRSLALGCVANPTPRHEGELPQPMFCLRSPGLSGAECGGALEPSQSLATPWSRTRASGFPTPRILTFQGVIADDGAANGSGFSITNGVTRALSRVTEKAAVGVQPRPSRCVGGGRSVTVSQVLGSGYWILILCPVAMACVLSSFTTTTW